MRSALFLVLGVAIGVNMPTVLGQHREIVSLNHVAIAVSDFTAASRFFSEGMGFPEAFAFRDSGGAPNLAYFQINRNTFVELVPVTPERPAGFVHFGLEVTQLDGLVKNSGLPGWTSGSRS